MRTFLTKATKIGSGTAIGAWLCAAASCDRFHTRQQVERARARVNNAHKLDGWAYCCAIFIPQLPAATAMSATGISCCLSQTYSLRCLRSLFDSQSVSGSLPAAQSRRVSFHVRFVLRTLPVEKSPNQWNLCVFSVKKRCNIFSIIIIINIFWFLMLLCVRARNCEKWKRKAIIRKMHAVHAKLANDSSVRR